MKHNHLLWPGFWFVSLFTALVFLHTYKITLFGCGSLNLLMTFNLNLNSVTSHKLICKTEPVHYLSVVPPRLEGIPFQFSKAWLVRGERNEMPSTLKGVGWTEGGGGGWLVDRWGRLVDSQFLKVWPLPWLFQAPLRMLLLSLLFHRCLVPLHLPFVFIQSVILVKVQDCNRLRNWVFHLKHMMVIYSAIHCGMIRINSTMQDCITRGTFQWETTWK